MDQGRRRGRAGQGAVEDRARETEGHRHPARSGSRRYLVAKSRKRSVSEDRRILGHLKDYFGKDTPLAEITASRISEYKGHRLSAMRKIGNGETAIERPLTGATVNRALALLRHLLRLAHDEWELLEVAL